MNLKQFMDRYPDLELNGMDVSFAVMIMGWTPGVTQWGTKEPCWLKEDKVYAIRMTDWKPSKYWEQFGKVVDQAIKNGFILPEGHGLFTICRELLQLTNEKLAALPIESVITETVEPVETTQPVVIPVT